MSHSETTDASYRIQFDPAEETEYFCYLGPGEQVLLAPDEEPYDEMESIEEEVRETVMLEGDAEMEEGEIEAGERDAKRQRVGDFSVTNM